jgi:hypothetical protein
LAAPRATLQPSPGRASSAPPEQRSGPLGAARGHGRLPRALRAAAACSRQTPETIRAGGAKMSTSLDTKFTCKKIGTFFVSPTHKRTEGRAPVWGSEFTNKLRTTGGIQLRSLLGCIIRNFCDLHCGGEALPSEAPKPIRNSHRPASNLGR